MNEIISGNTVRFIECYFPACCRNGSLMPSVGNVDYARRRSTDNFSLPSLFSTLPSMFQAYQKLTGMPRARSLRSYTLAHTAAASSSANDPITPASRPLSPTFSETSQTTNISQMHFGSSGPEKIITRGDLKTSLTAYDNVSYR